MASPFTCSHEPICRSRSSKIGSMRPSCVGPTFISMLPPQLKWVGSAGAFISSNGTLMSVDYCSRILTLHSPNKILFFSLINTPLTNLSTTLIHLPTNPFTNCARVHQSIYTTNHLCTNLFNCQPIHISMHIFETIPAPKLSILSFTHVESD